MKKIISLLFLSSLLLAEPYKVFVAKKFFVGTNKKHVWRFEGKEPVPKDTIEKAIETACFIDFLRDPKFNNEVKRNRYLESKVRDISGYYETKTVLDDFMKELNNFSNMMTEQKQALVLYFGNLIEQTKNFNFNGITDFLGRIEEISKPVKEYAVNLIVPILANPNYYAQFFACRVVADNSASVRASILEIQKTLQKDGWTSYNSINLVREWVMYTALLWELPKMLEDMEKEIVVSEDSKARACKAIEQKDIYGFGKHMGETYRNTKAYKNYVNAVLDNVQKIQDKINNDFNLNILVDQDFVKQILGVQ
ncbi:MAG: hypothetical protein QXP53_02455 [Candidatus Pacearchaeota archaeon]